MIEVVQQTVGLLAFLVAGFVAYIKFFMGRMILTCADIEISLDCIPAPNNKILQAVTVCVTNKGNVAIPSPIARLSIQLFPSDGDELEIIDPIHMVTFANIRYPDKRISIQTKEFIFSFIENLI